MTFPNLTDKPLPQDRESEQAVAYLVLTDDVALLEAPKLVPPTVFFNPDIRLIYETALEVSSGVADVVKVRQTLQDRHQMTEGVTETLAVLSDTYASLPTFPWHAARLWRAHQLRQLIVFGCALLKDACGPSASPDELLSRCADLFTRTERPNQDDGTFSPEAETILAQEDSRHSGILTGLEDVDARLQGLRKGESLILGARPGIGKTALATQVAAHVALDLGIRTAYFTLEMDKQSLLERIASQRTGVRFESIRRKRMAEGEAGRVAELMETLKDHWPLKIFKCRRFSADDFEAHARRLVALDGCGFIVVDYVQRMAWPKGCREKRLAVEENCRRIVDLAGELNVPVMVVSQLNRSAEGVEPGLEHLAESGTIEADADIILLLHRANRIATDALAILAKQRNGQACSVSLTWRPEVVRFESFAHSPY